MQIRIPIEINTEDLNDEIDVLTCIKVAMEELTGKEAKAKMKKYNKQFSKIIKDTLKIKIDGYYCFAYLIIDLEDGSIRIEEYK